ncbi:MAG: response regulator [Pirellulales bacterium]
MTLPILLVDDDRDTCSVVATLLRAWHYEVDVANEGRTALRLTEEKPYALAIIDYRMPGMNGVELFREMRDKRPEIVGIFMTGYTTIDVVYPAIESGVLRVLTKPVDFNELKPIIEEHVGVPA